MLMDAYRDERPGVRVVHRTDGHLLNQRWMVLQSRVSTTTAHELLFVDDCTLNTTSGGDMERSKDLFAAACNNLGLIINTKKRVVMHQPPPDTIYVNVDGAQLLVVGNFTYLGSTLSRGEEVACRIFKASQTFDGLQNTCAEAPDYLVFTYLFIVLELTVCLTEW
nr:unnamed protein product [Spirometra erinaceieuropaei]